MAQGQRNGNGEQTPEQVPTPESPPVPFVAVSQDQWISGGAASGFATYESNVAVPISGDTGNAILCNLPVPTATDVDNMVRAYYGHAMRVAQAVLKAFDKANPTANAEQRTAAAQAGVESACNGAYKPKRERNDTPAEDEAEHRFVEHCTTLVRAQKPDATQAVIDATVKKMRPTDAGKAWVEKALAEVLKDRQLFVARKSDKATEAEAIEVTL